MIVGIRVSCDTILDAHLIIEFPSTLLTFVDLKKDISIHLNDKNDSAVVHFPIFKDVERMFLVITSSCAAECSIAAHVTAR